MKVAILGLGYVGLPLAVRAAETGHSVVGIDLDKSKIGSLRTGVSYIEDVSDARLNAVNNGRVGLLFSPEMLLSHADFDIAVVTVPTPLRQGEPDLSYILAAATSLGLVMRQDKYGRTDRAVVLESTTYPGTTEGVFRETLEEHSGLTAGEHFHLGFSPERIDPGPSLHTLENTPKLVSATTPEGLRVIQGFYDTIVERTVAVSSPKVAELAKVFENVQAYVNIALVNELADLSHALGVDVHETIDAAMTKGHSMARWKPGPGVGGHCLPIDSLYLTWQAREQLGHPARLIEMAAQINESRPGYVVDRAASMLTERDIAIRDARVLVMGLAYKPDVADLRESPALSIVQGLVGRGMQVTVTDPLVEGWTMTPVLGIEELAGALPDFDLVVIATDHNVFDFEKVASLARQVLDTRNVLRRSETVVAL